MKHVQISEELFVRLCWYHLFGKTEDHAEAIKEGLEEKLTAVEKREAYTKYKQGDEDARRKYLDLAGVLEDFRW